MAADVARTLVDEGVALIELCGGLTLSQAAAVEALNGPQDFIAKAAVDAGVRERVEKLYQLTRERVRMVRGVCRATARG